MIRWLNFVAACCLGISLITLLSSKYSPAYLIYVTLFLFLANVVAHVHTISQDGTRQKKIKQIASNMQNKIWKFPLTNDPIQTVELPSYSRILYVNIDLLNEGGEENAALWVEAPEKDTLLPFVKIKVGIVRTGDAYDTGKDIWQYLGSVYLNDFHGEEFNNHIFQINSRSN